MNRLYIVIISILLPFPFFGQQVNVRIDKKKIPTYRTGPAQANPIFFTGRVYQGAEGYVYPYPLYDVLTDTIDQTEYQTIELNNEYVNISVLPEMGGRIFSAKDNTNNYPFFYSQSGIKPALVGMTGAWLSGGVEWNIPDHHRASSYMPLNWKTKVNEDGSRTIWVGETEFRHRLKWSVGISVYPGRSWVEAKVMVINPTSMIQSMLYWANVSVHCDENYKVIFPPDVQAGADHHKVYFTPWPLGEAIVGSGIETDLSWWKNFDGDSRSVFAWGSKMNFLAGYDFKKDAGTVHVANRHIVGGKKFFLWGNNPTGMMWNKILSDKDGHYLELMVGAYSDNQPDYSWIDPGEIREFTQIWYPIKGIKGVKNATIDAAVNFECIRNSTYRVGYCVTTQYKNARVIVKNENRILCDERIDIDPDAFFIKEIEIPNVSDESKLYTALFDKDENILVDYRPVVLEPKPLPKVIEGTKPVEEYKSNEELYLAGLRVDQFNNARLDYMTFYNEALRRDSLDVRVNIEVGKHYIRQGEWNKAKEHLLRAQKRLSHDYTSVKNAEALYYLGNVFESLGEREKAQDAYWAATWTPAYKHRSFYELAVMAIQDKDYSKALDLITQSLYVGVRDKQALMLKTYVCRMLGEEEKALETIQRVEQIDPLDLWCYIEKYFFKRRKKPKNNLLRDELRSRNHGFIAVQELLEVITNYNTFGAYDDAITILEEALSVGAPYSEFPIVLYYQTYALLKNGRDAKAADIMRQAKNLSNLHNCFFRLEEIELLQTLLQHFPDEAYTHYHFGNLLYYIGQKQSALTHWTKSVDLNPDFSIACRNAGFAFRMFGDLQKSLEYYEMALRNNPDDPLLLTESDKICEMMKMLVKIRLKRMEKYIHTVMKHDDAVMRLLLLYIQTEQYDKAVSILDHRHFHSWEGGGEIHDIYVDSHLLNGITLLKDNQYRKALHEFELAELYPSNLEVARPVGGKFEPKIFYLIGFAYEKMNQKDKARKYYQKSADEPFKNYVTDLNYFKVLSLRKMGNKEAVVDLITKMKDVLEKSQQGLLDSYAKFGNEVKEHEESNLLYNSGLIDLLEGNDKGAAEYFDQAVERFPGNTWSKTMKGNHNALY